MRTYRFFVTFILSILLVGCVVPSKYIWGNYDQSLYNYYKDAAKSAEHTAELQKIILDSEKTQGKVAPGIHAEYGYFLMQQGKSNEAVSQFEIEKTKWPESTLLMNNMITIATSKTSKQLKTKE